MDYEFLDHTADIKFRAYGKTLEECLSNAAKALFNAIHGDSKIDQQLVKELSVIVHKKELLVHDFLTEFIYMFSTEQMLFSGLEMDLKEAIGYKLMVKASGEVYDAKKHKLAKEVKAVTYHDMIIEQNDDGWMIQVVCDT